MPSCLPDPAPTRRRRRVGARAPSSSPCSVGSCSASSCTSRSPSSSPSSARAAVRRWPPTAPSDIGVGLRRAARADEAAAAEFRVQLERARESAAQRAWAVDRGLVGAVGDSFGTHRLWERRHEHADMAMVTLGVGSRTWSPPIVDECSPPRASPMDATWALVESLATLDDVPITIDLAPGQCIGLTGDVASTRALARSLVVQLACQVGPADLRLAMVTGDDDRSWAWAQVAAPRPGRRPERRGPGGGARVAPRRGPGSTTRDARSSSSTAGGSSRLAPRRCVGSSNAIPTASP